MSALQGLEWTFDTVAPTYEKFRPGYPAGVYQTILDYVALGPSSHAVEVGIGGGQATLPFLQTGCALTAVEVGVQFSERCREKFRDYPRFSVITDKFENVAFPDAAHDLVYSASAFHWVPESVGYAKVFAMLKSGGAFARFANHPYRDKGNPPLSEAINQVYADYYYKYYDKAPENPVEYSEEQASQRAGIAEKYGFADIKYALFHRTRTFTAHEYRTLIGTYSDHIAIEEGFRNEFFSKIEEVINAHGGSITIYDTIDLQLARKP
ncbi:MAG: class I SAM-dependent methyltransferase [Christensenellaceae bacterium]|nr:class I SAM-dependent methyltransferase [Christensenellaceae bacterium]